MEPSLPFLSAADADRASRSLRKLSRHETSRWALTGGLAFELHAIRLGMDARERALNDLDFVAASFEAIPETLAEDFLFRHIHPHAAPGKTMLQLIDRDQALRIDVFRASPATMRRAAELVSLEDLVARAARLLLDLGSGLEVASKHARDYLRFSDAVDADGVEAAWQDHRKREHPTTFREANAAIQVLIPASAHLLITARFSDNPDEACSVCTPIGAFQLADPKLVLSLLGYC